MKIDSELLVRCWTSRGRSLALAAIANCFRKLSASFSKTRRLVGRIATCGVGWKRTQAVRSTAHALKGLAAGCGGMRAAQAAQRVENAGAEGDLENIDSLMMDTLESELRAIAAQPLQATSRNVRESRSCSNCSAAIKLPPARLRPARACRSTRPACELCSASSRA